MTIEDFGARVASVWEGLRPSTRHLVERALLATQTTASATAYAAARRAAAYDARSEWELSRLLAALDERATEAGAQVLSAAQSLELVRMTEACVAVLDREARSAEVFGQLLERALRAHDYARVDALADTLSARLVPGETCELARHPHPAVRALANEALLLLPTAALVALLSDPVDADIARGALEHQADELGLEEARWVVNALEQEDYPPDEL